MTGDARARAPPRHPHTQPKRPPKKTNKQGPAVWALRAQTDKLEYSRVMRRVLEDEPNLELREGQAVDVTLGPNGEVTGVVTHFGITFVAKAVVLTTGGFVLSCCAACCVLCCVLCCAARACCGFGCGAQQNSTQHTTQNTHAKKTKARL